MSLELLAPLGVLALIDSTSFGTLLIPVWFLLAPGRLRPGRILVFLGTVAGFYLLLGLVLVAGMGTFLGDVGRLLDNPVVARAQLVVGVGLVVWSFFIGKKKRDGNGRLLRWRDRAMAEGTGLGGLMGLALAAALVEVASMLPYLAATGLIGAADLSWPQRVLVLAAYCLVMILPALVLLALRLVARRLVTPLLDRISRWMAKNGGETTAWIVGIVGFLIARDALVRVPEILGFINALDAL
ncbi:GAP family protein [Georgenia sp. MJ173]|uniref:GAP family protein n=1 Tax=Georgenia sunbinii TaxID=3117728 RepID=UPI002F25EEA1